MKAQGYTGSSRSVYRRLAKWRDQPPKRATPASPGSIPHSPFEDVTEGAGHRVDAGPSPAASSRSAQEQLDRITQMDAILAQARELTHGFLHLIRHHSSEGLESWRKSVRASGIREFLTFARSIERDKAAIVAGLTLPVSHGASGRAHQSPQTRSVGKPMAELGFPTCNTAFCPLLSAYLVVLAPRGFRH